MSKFIMMIFLIAMTLVGLAAALIGSSTNDRDMFFTGAILILCCWCKFNSMEIDELKEQPK